MPFAACTATATPDKHQRIRAGLGFDEGKALLILEGVNRPNLFFAVRIIEGGGYGDVDLNFLIPPNLDLLSVQWIPKTLIYIDNKKHAPKLAVILRSLLTPEFRVHPPRPDVWDGDPRTPAECLVVTYHATVSDTMRRLIEADWKSGKARIMIASSAWV